MPPDARWIFRLLRWLPGERAAFRSRSAQSIRFGRLRARARPLRQGEDGCGLSGRPRVRLPTRDAQIPNPRCLASKRLAFQQLRDPWRYVPVLSDLECHRMRHRLQAVVEDHEDDVAAELAQERVQEVIDIQRQEIPETVGRMLRAKANHPNRVVVDVSLEGVSIAGSIVVAKPAPRHVATVVGVSNAAVHGVGTSRVRRSLCMRSRDQGSGVAVHEPEQVVIVTSPEAVFPSSVPLISRN